MGKWILIWYSIVGSMHSIGKMSVTAIIVPTSQIICNLERRGYTLLEELREALQALIVQYQQLIHKVLNDFYDGKTGTMGAKHMLDVMDSSQRLTSIRQSGQMHWKCQCTLRFRNMGCHHSALYSASWDPAVRVPSNLQKVPIIPNSKGKTVPSIFYFDKFSWRRRSPRYHRENPRSQALTTQSHLLGRQRWARGQRRGAQHSQSQSLTTSKTRPWPAREGGASSI